MATERVATAHLWEHVWDVWEADMSDRGPVMAPLAVMGGASPAKPTIGFCFFPFLSWSGVWFGWEGKTRLY